MQAQASSSDPAAARRQAKYLRRDLAVALEGRRRGLFTFWLNQRFWAVVCYRLERALYLLSGPAWPVLRHPVRLLLALIRPAGVEISPMADIGAGFVIYHPALGIVIAPQTQAGANLVLTGGNCIGVRRVFGAEDQLRLGDRVVLGANAVVLGPIRVGDCVWVGAGAVVTRDAPSGSVVRAPSSSAHSAPA